MSTGGQLTGAAQRRLWQPTNSQHLTAKRLYTAASILEEPLPASSISIESVAYDQGTFTCRGVLASAAAPELVYSVLCDYR